MKQLHWSIAPFCHIQHVGTIDVRLRAEQFYRYSLTSMGGFLLLSNGLCATDNVNHGTVQVKTGHRGALVQTTYRRCVKTVHKPQTLPCK